MYDTFSVHYIYTVIRKDWTYILIRPFCALSLKHKTGTISICSSGSHVKTFMWKTCAVEESGCVWKTRANSDQNLILSISRISVSTTHKIDSDK